MKYRPNYPATVKEVLGEVKYKKDTLQALERFRASRPWRGDRVYKFIALHRELCRVYGKKCQLVFRNSPGHSGSSFYDSQHHVIVLLGRLSVVTYLHEFGHLLGKDERQACRWSINLFAKIFPKSFAKAEFRGHVIVK